MTQAIVHAGGGYRFLPGIGPYSAGVAAAEGFTLEHVRFARPIPLRAGFDAVDSHLRAAGRPRQALCSIALRSPAPFTFAGFAAFNNSYIDILRSWSLLVDGVNPIARTNVAPEIDPPDEPSLYSFGYTVPGNRPPSFVVAGSGELPEGSLDPNEIVRRDETSPDAIAAKARFVMDLMGRRLAGLGAGWDSATFVNIYTIHDVGPLVSERILPAAAVHGLTWHFTRPPIIGIEFEMDVRGCARETLLA